MRVIPKCPPRKFKVGLQNQFEVSDCGKIELASDEQVTFITPSGKEYDVAAKSWGFYATPSVNGRLVAQGFRTALVRNSFGKLYVMLVDPEHMDEFKKYLTIEKQTVEKWLSED